MPAGLALEFGQYSISPEDLRDAWGPSKVLHFATALAGLSDTGPILPYFSPLSAAQLEQLAHVSKTLVERNAVTCAA